MSDFSERPWTADDARAYAGAALTGETVRLRGLRMEDLDLLAFWRQQPEIGIFQDDVLNPPSDAAARNLIALHGSASSGDDHRGFSVETLGGPTESPVLLGFVALSGITLQHRSAEFSISLDTTRGGLGYGLDATRTAVRYGFRELGLHRIELSVLAFNGRALTTYRRAGFVEEGRRRDAVFHDGRWHDEVLMSVLATDDPWRPPRRRRARSIAV